MSMRSLIPAAVFTVLATLTGCDTSPTGVLETGKLAVLVVTPASASLKHGATLQLRVTAQDQNGQPVIPSEVAWTTSNAAVATVSTTGMVTGNEGGASQISAWWNGVRGGTTVTVLGDKATPCSVDRGNRDLALKQICVPR